MDVRGLSTLPGADLVLKGLGDLACGRDSVEALLVQVGAPRLRTLGIDVQSDEADVSPEHRLYARLSAADGLREYFGAIEGDLYRFPAIDVASFRRAVDEATRSRR